jgi:hypothetical protein
MPIFEGGGRVKDTYGLENAAEMIRRQGREGDTVLAHINPQEAGILQLLGGSGTINPYTGLPEFNFLKKVVPKPIYKLGSKIGKEIERGVESIARNEILGPIAQMAAAYFGGPIGAGIYAGLAKPGSSFDVKNAAKAAALTYAGQQISQGLGQTGGGGYDVYDFGDVPSGGGGYGGPEIYDFGDVPSSVPVSSGPGAPSSYPVYDYGSPSVESAVSSAAADPLANVQAISAPASGIGEPLGQYASAGAPVTDVPTTSGGGGYDVYDYGSPYDGGGLGDTGVPQPARVFPGGDTGDIPGVTSTPGATPPDTRNIFRQGYDAVKQGYNTAVDAVESGIRSVIPEPIQDAYGATKDFVKDLIPPDYREALGVAKDVALIGSGATTAYGMYKTKKELDDAKDEANRILADRENKKKEEIEWAQGVLRDYPYNYQRLTEEDVRRERGMAMGGRINSYDDEPGMDDGMMQGGIAALAKGGLPPRYLRGGGDGMSDSIRARIGGKQEARLADGEFVVPADVVSHLGNGSSNAGAKKLYAMMDRVRKSRTGKTRQAPEVNTRRLMPA